MKFSIVTTSYNSAPYLAQAIESALSQHDTVESFEHIVADAESEDDTSRILSAYPHLKVDIRRDRGIYDGMNRAIGMAEGDVIVILNADDILPPNALATAQNRLTTASSDILTGGFQLMDARGTIQSGGHLPTSPPSREGLLFGIPAINTRFIRRKVFEKIGMFDLSFGLAADREWLVRAFEAGIDFGQVDQYFYVYREHAGSATLAGDPKTRRRLHTDHLALADRLSRSAGRDLARALRSFEHLEMLKLALLEIRQGGSITGASPRAAGARLLARALSNPSALTRGLSDWRRWRGHHSDT